MAASSGIDNAGRFKVVALDIDGTVLRSCGGAPPYFPQLLDRLHRNGVRVVFCTGRRWRSALSLPATLSESAHSVIVCAGGALIKDFGTQATLRTLPMSASTAAGTGDLFRRCGLVPYFLRDCAPPEPELLVAASDREAAEGLFYVPKHRRDVCFFEGSCPEVRDPLLVVYTVDRVDKVLAAAAYITKRYGERVRVTALKPPSFDDGYWALEAHDARTSKWHALKLLLDDWGVRADQVVAIGDDVNDIPMLRGAGLSFAMGNGVAAAREAADCVTGSNDDDGVLHALESLFPGLTDEMSQLHNG